MKGILRVLRSWPFIIVVAASLALIGYEVSVERPAEVYIREGYAGWVRIEYGVRGAPKLPVFWNGPILGYKSFPESGLLQTSSQLKRDFPSVEFNYDTVMEWRRIPEEKIRCRVSSQNITKPDGSHFEREFEILFIGSKEPYEHHRNELERFKKGKDKYVIATLEDLPKVGNIPH
jgi:hypothetical protein